MANSEHLHMLKQGTAIWKEWRRQNRIRPDLREAMLRGANLSGAYLSYVYLSGADLSEANLKATGLSGADLSRANLRGADLSEADLSEANLSEADLSAANLNGANLSGARLIETNLSKAKLIGADLSKADLSKANFNGANLFKADLSETIVVGTYLRGANLTNCSIYGISVWDVKLDEAIQSDLVITSRGQSAITVDNLKIAQFVYLFLENQEIRDVINTLTTKAVLILGSFTSERKAILKALKTELRKQNYLPILFDFEKPVGRNYTETVRILAHLARFIVADLTEPRSIPHELQSIVPNLGIAIQPILLEKEKPHAMFDDFKRYHWVLPIYYYENQSSLIARLREYVIEPAEKKAQELEKD